MIDVAIYGATGYTALELIHILLRHPEVRIRAVTSRQDAGKPLHAVHSGLYGRLDLTFEDLSPTELAERCSFVFCCVPHGASMAVIPELLASGVRVVDLSADYRLSDPGVYEQWYGLVHTDPTRLGETIYGLPELFRDQIPGKDLIANPGCYTSTSILALAPLISKGLIEPEGIIINAKSGVSGAGRALKLNTLFAECNESFAAYGVGTHRHQPEIEQVLANVGDNAVDVIFQPHLVPMDRGILATIYATPKTDLPVDDVLGLMREYYADSPFVRIVDHLPKTKDVAHTNYCDITIRQSKSRWIVLSVLDNLIKGAAGVAVQNFNLMHGFEESLALR